MNKAYLLMLCLISASFTGCISDDSDDVITDTTDNADNTDNSDTTDNSDNTSETDGNNATNVSHTHPHPARHRTIYMWATH